MDAGEDHHYHHQENHQDNINPMASFDEVFQGVENDPLRSNDSMTAVIRGAESVQSRLSAAVGWKSDTHFPFCESFKGYYIKYLPDSNDVVLYNWSEGEAVRMAIHPTEDGGIEVVGAEAMSLKGVHSEAQAPAVLESLVKMMESRVLSEGNIAKATKYSHGGNIAVPYIRLDNEVVVGLPKGCPLALKKQFESFFSPRFGNCAFIPADELRRNFQDYYDRNLYPGLEPGSLQLDMLYYNGESLFNRVTVNIPGGLSPEARERDAELLDSLKAGMRNIRRELQICAGCPEDHDYNIRFSEAFYPVDNSPRADVVTVASQCGRECCLMMNVHNGSVVLSEDIDGNTSQAVKKVSVEEALAYVSKIVLSEDNLSVAAAEVRDYNLAVPMDTPAESREAIYAEGLLNRMFTDINLTVVGEEKVGDLSIFHIMSGEDSRTSFLQSKGEFYFPVNQRADRFINAHAVSLCEWQDTHKNRFIVNGGELKRKEQKQKSQGIKR